MSDFRKLGVPFLIIFISALVDKLCSIYLPALFTSLMFKILMVIALCVFGASLNINKRRGGRSVFKKVLAILMILFLLFMQLQLFTFASVASIFDFFGVDAFYINMLYIFCGYLFME